MELVNVIFEERRIHLEAYADYLRDEGYTCNVLQNDEGDWVLTVTVKGSGDTFAQFDITDYPEEDGYFEMRGIYLSDALPEGKFDHWVFPREELPARICEDVIIPFTDDCFFEAYSNVLEIVGITDENLDEFVPFLDDRALTVENIRAIGIYEIDGDDKYIVGAASFGETDDSIVIENITLLPEYEGEAIEDFVVEFIRRNL